MPTLQIVVSPYPVTPPPVPITDRNAETVQPPPVASPPTPVHIELDTVGSNLRFSPAEILRAQNAVAAIVGSGKARDVVEATLRSLFGDVRV